MGKRIHIPERLPATMWNICAVSDAGAVPCPSLTLERVWQVYQDHRYQVALPPPTVTHHIAARTLGGRGYVHLRDGHRVILSEGTVFLCARADALAWGTDGPHWQFTWFEFHGTLPSFLWGQPIAIPGSLEEDLFTDYCVRRVSSHLSAHRAEASALFAALLHLWSAVGEHDDANQEPLRHLVDRALAIMQTDLAAPLHLEALSRACGVSSRWLRLAFLRVLGMPPKAYHTHLRLTQVASALRMGLGTLAMLADQYGYSSPFHLSRAFTAKFGCSPTAYLRGQHTVTII